MKQLRNRLLIVLLGFLILFGISFFVLQTIQQNRMWHINTIRRDELSQIFTKIILSEEEELGRTVRDYAWWTDTAEFIASGDQKWADENLSGTIESFNLDYILVIDPAGKEVYAYSRNGDPTRIEVHSLRAEHAFSFKFQLPLLYQIWRWGVCLCLRQHHHPHQR